MAIIHAISDTEILARMREGKLQVCVMTATVYSIKGKLTKEKSSRGQYDFVKIKIYPRRRKIAVHKLVWMASTMLVIPPGYEIDHIHGRISDAIWNLRLLTKEEHDERHGRTKREDKLF